MSAAGFRAVAPDMRGYGGTEAPEPIDQYTLFHLVGDMAELVKALGETKAVIVGHDWGAPVAWHAALWRPDLFTAVCAMSVPYVAAGLRRHPERAGEARDQRLLPAVFPEARRARGRAAAGHPRRAAPHLLHGRRRAHREGQGLRPADRRHPARQHGRSREAAGRGSSEADLDYYAGEFARTGFRGGLNWYRNLRRNWELGGPWRGQPIRQPSLFIAGSRDGVLRFPAAKSQLEAYPKTLPGLRGSHILEGAGHWVQQEQPAEVNKLLIDFLKGL